MQRCDLAVVILAAGIGKRMRSDTPKVLHQLGGRPLVHWVVKTAVRLEPERIVVVTGHGGERVRESLKEFDISFAVQSEQLGTGHAVMQAESRLEDFDGNVMVLSGDVPMIKLKTLEKLIEVASEKNCGLAFLTTEPDDPAGYGRILRGLDGEVKAVIEERDANPEQLLIKEINGGVYLFDKRLLFETLPQISADNDQKEYYLTDAVKTALNGGEKVTTLKLDDPVEISGVNSREELEKLERLISQSKEYGNCPAW